MMQRESIVGGYDDKLLEDRPTSLFQALSIRRSLQVQLRGREHPRSAEDWGARNFTLPLSPPNPTQATTTWMPSTWHKVYHRRPNPARKRGGPVANIVNL